jgi:hypothetical protein
MDTPPIQDVRPNTRLGSPDSLLSLPSDWCCRSERRTFRTTGQILCEVELPLSRYLARMMVRYASGVIVPLKCRRGHEHLNFSVQGLCDTQDFPVAVFREAARLRS